MAEGKNGGYIRWAKKYNVKQFAESILFLQQHNIRDLETLNIMIDGLREQRQIKDISYVRKEKDELVDIVGNIAGKVDVVERENKKGESFKVVNFSVISNDSLGNKIYHNCSAYGEKGEILKNFKQGDFVKIFGQVRTSTDDRGKEHRNINILSSRLLKAKEQTKEIAATSDKEKLNNGIMERGKNRESVCKGCH